LPSWGDLEPPATEPESYEPQEALDIMDETADEFDDEESEKAAATTASAGGQSADGENATDERRPRRRRRRRGRGRSREGVANEPGKEVAPEEGVLSESTESSVDDSVHVDGSVQEPAEKERLEGERTERRGRRRRRGRGRGRDQIRDEQPVVKEGAEDDDKLAFAGAEEEGMVDVDVDAADEHDDEYDVDDEHDVGEHDEHDDGEHDEHEDGEHDDDDESPRIGFRNISTWQDAIGAIIAKNMESRSRNPGGSRGSGGRGGRGRRPDRR